MGMFGYFFSTFEKYHCTAGWRVNWKGGERRQEAIRRLSGDPGEE